MLFSKFPCQKLPINLDKIEAKYQTFILIFKVFKKLEPQTTFCNIDINSFYFICRVLEQMLKKQKVKKQSVMQYVLFSDDDVQLPSHSELSGRFPLIQWWRNRGKGRGSLRLGDSSLWSFWWRCSGFDDTASDTSLHMCVALTF